MDWLKKLLGLALCTSLSLAAAMEVNTATEAELDSIHGIGPAMSQRILQERQRTAFTDWQDLMQRVSGMGQKKAAQFSSQGLTVNGKSFAPPAPAKPAASNNG